MQKIILLTLLFFLGFFVRAQENTAMDRYYATALKLARQGNLDKAIQNFESTLKNTPNDKEALLALGACLYIQGDKEKAGLVYERVYQMDPDSEDNIVRLESIYKQLGDKEKIIRLSERIQARNPENTIIAFKLANLYREAGNQDKALYIYEELIKVNPRHTASLFYIGLIHYEKGDKERAVLLFEEVLKINPRHREALSNLGAIHYELGNREEAIRLFVKGSETGDLNAKRILEQLGHTMSYKQGDTVSIDRVDIKPQIVVKSKSLDVLSKDGMAELTKHLLNVLSKCTVLKKYLEAKVFRNNEMGRVIVQMYFTKEGKIEATLITRFLENEALAEVQNEFSSLLEKRKIKIVPAMYQNRAVRTGPIATLINFTSGKKAAEYPLSPGLY